MEKILKMVEDDLHKARCSRPCYSKLAIPHSLLLSVLQQCYKSEVVSKGRDVTEFPNELEVIAKWLMIESVRPWMIIYGRLGNGKTTTSIAIQSLYHSIKQRARESLKCRRTLLMEGGEEYVKQCEYLSSIPEPQAISAKELSLLASTNTERFEKLKGARILIIDDIGIEPPKVMNFGTEVNPIADVLYYRYDNRMMTILTTNKDYQQLRELYGERIADRMNECASRVGFSASSYR